MARRGKLISGVLCMVLVGGLCTVAVVFIRARKFTKSPADRRPRPVPAAITAPDKPGSTPDRDVPAGVIQPDADQKSELPVRADPWPGRLPAVVKLEKKDLLAELNKPMTAEEKDLLSKSGILCNSSRSLTALRRDPSVIFMRNAIIDTSVIAEGGPSVEIPEDFRADKDTTRFIVQFEQPLSGHHKAALSAAGATVEHYVPNRGYAVTADAEAIEKVKAMSGVTHVEPFHPYFKMSSDVQAYLMGTAGEETAGRVKTGEYNVLFFSGDEPGAELEKLGAKVTVRRGGGNIKIGKVDCLPDLLDRIVKADVVKWVEPRVPMKVLNDLANNKLRGNVVKLGHPGLDGSGVIVCVADTGVDHTHRAFAIDPNQETSYPNNNTRIVYYEARAGGPYANGQLDDLIGHGSHVSGSVLGNGGWSGNVIKSPGSGNAPYAANHFAGIAPAARLVILEDFNSFANDELTKTLYDKGARIMNNSWGASVYDYGTMCAEWDALVRDADTATDGNQSLIVFFSAGNDGAGNTDGYGGTAGTIGQPGNAKNVITIGAVEQRRLCNNLDVSPYNSVANTDTDWQIANFSSRGRTPDERMKPDLVAPGSYVMSVQTKDVDFDSVDWPEDVDRDYRHGNLDSGTNYAVMSGTSMASPLSAGAGALLYQYYTNAYGKAPSPAMMKAMMVNGAMTLHSIFYEMEAYGPAVVDEGWGMIDLSGTIDGPRVRTTDEVLFFDQEDAIGEADESVDKYYAVTGSDQGGLKVVLAWTDAPGTPGAGNVLVNDLDLVVTAPDGKVYQGNYMGRRVWGTTSYDLTAYSTNYGDRANNVEVVVIRHLKPGNYTIQVRGYQIPQPNQDYALVITKGVSSHGDSAGAEPALSLDANGFPVLANICSDTGNPGDWGIMGVRRWVGGFGESAEYGTWRQLKGKWFDYGTDWNSEIISGSVLDSQVREPSVAVNTANGNVDVAWKYESFEENDPDCIYLRYWNGTTWGDLGGSYQSFGICDSDITMDAYSPCVGIAWDGHPVVSYVQTYDYGRYKDITVKKWSGSAWVGLGSDTGFVLPGSYAANVDMVMDQNSRPVVVWRDKKLIKCYRWNGSSWTCVASDLGSRVEESRPKVTVNGSSIYVTWIEYGEDSGHPLQTVRVATTTGSSWTGIGGSMTYPGVSGTNTASLNPQIGYGKGDLFVAWQSGDTDENRVLAEKWNGSQWTGISGSDSAGIAHLSGRSELYSMVVNRMGLAVLGIQNNRTGQENTVVYGLAGDMVAPAFSGLDSAEGTSNNTVILSWTPVAASGQTITYHIYRTPGSGWACSDMSIPESDDAGAIAAVFGNEIAAVANTNAYVVSGLTSDMVWYFGVRAENESGLIDSNTKILLTGPYNLAGDADGDWLTAGEELAIGTDPVNRDTDDDGMWDGWEWFYSTNNYGQFSGIPAHTNALAMDPLTTSEGPYEDLDSDALLNIEEFQFWINNYWVSDFTTIDRTDPTRWWLDPTNPDTDGDGMGDGWESLNGLDPADVSDASGDPDGDGLSNTNEYAWSSDPNWHDSDYDGLDDGDEVNTWGSDPSLADTDDDGLEDGLETNVNANLLLADTDGDGVSDGDEYQLGYDDVSASGTNVNLLLHENFEDAPGTWTNWTHSSSLADLWHRTTADPDPPTPSPVYLYDHTTNHSFRCANDPTMSDTNATYDMSGQIVESKLVSPTVDASAAVNLYLSWNEHYETEAEHDTCIVGARQGSGGTWQVVRVGVSGITTGWVHRVVDLSGFAGAASVQVRFQFSTDNTINNAYHGWYVDDIRIYGATCISGVVRNVNGAPLNGAVVYAIGRGGVTNRTQGHSYVLPGKIFGQAATAEDGSYAINGLFQGQYYVKATHTGFKSEFWNGVLYTNTPYYTAFGKQINPGVTDRSRVSTNGIADLTSPNSGKTCNFELEAGASRGCLGVLTDSDNYPVYLSQVATNVTVWNGETSTATRAFVPYTTTNAVPFTYPDWETNNWENNGIRPTLIADIAEGEYLVYMHPGWSNMPYAPEINVPIRDGEITLVSVGTNFATGQIYVRSEDWSYPIFIDERDTGYNTTGTDSPTIISVAAGDHEVAVRPTGINRQVVPKQVTVPVAGRVNVSFTLNEVYSAQGSVRIETADLHGNQVTGAEVFVNGRRVTTNDVAGSSTTTPLVLINLNVGDHWVTVLKHGYRPAERRAMTAYDSLTNTVRFSLYEADMDYDLVGDATETAGYTNILLYSRSDDPDSDGVDNLTEYDQFRLHNVRMNILDPDSDDDMMLDGQELAYDGQTNRLAFGVLQDNASIGDSSVKVYFRGRFLAGENAFNTNRIAAGNMWVSIEGDLIKVTNLLWAADNFGTPVLDFRVPAVGVPSNVVSVGHDLNASVYADTFPDTVDTDGDGMWDGFEYTNQIMGVAGCNPVDADGADQDPDNDGLSNINEFLGADGTANTNDCINPGNPDSDNDLMPDGWEIEHGLDPLDSSDAALDADGDGLVNLDEWQWLTDPHNADSDNDALTDGLEVHTYGCDPLLLDSDYDGLLDGEEVWDTDLDPLTGLDGGFFPNWAGGDLDNDGLLDGPTDWDTDGDGMPDGFEVKDVWGNVRPVDLRLDPYDPTDGPLDYDGDGLSNLSEYLVRDALVGYHPSDFGVWLPSGGATAAVIWDYSTDPFNADSDGDGMPDGFEAWRGLHPMDPVRDPDTGELVFVRHGDLWLFGDLDYDGVVNQNEYDVRFMLDSGADSNALEGSTHPWLTDTDGDGLEDGEEIKAFRTNPLNQDTDADGLMDGSALTDRMGEVHSSTIAAETNQYDRAMNDLWRLYKPKLDPYPEWAQVYSNGIAGSPAPRWGGAGAASGYKVLDSKKGEYVGQPVSGFPIGDTEQVLLQNSTFTIFGGRDGVEHFDEVWEYDGTNRWRLMPATAVFDDLSECAAATKIYTLDTYVAGSTLRPRPGAPPGFPFYDGDPDTDPLEILWRTKPDDPGSPTLPNWDRTLVFGGWDEWHAYDGGYIYDSAVNEDETVFAFLLYEPRYYKSADMTNITITYWWKYAADAFQWDSLQTGLATNQDIDGNIHIGATTNDFIYAGINIENVLNMSNELRAVTVLNATLQFELYNPYSDPTSFQVRVMGELDDIWTETVADQTEHPTLTSPQTYYTIAGQPSENRPWGRIEGGTTKWAFNTPESIETISMNPGWQTYDIDVTAHVRAMLEAQHVVSAGPPEIKATWEFGNSMGFLIVGMTNSPSTAYIDEGTEKLRIEVSYPHYITPDNMTAFKENGVDMVISNGWVYKKKPVLVIHPHQRKSTAMAYSAGLDKFVLFGGIDGVRALNDTWTSTDGFDGWQLLLPATRPPARWGHCMVEGGAGVIVFGGFDSRNRPLNDMWEFDGTDWVEVVPEDAEVPAPRGGAAMGHVGGWIAMFGGTDGDRYFNDTWVLNLPGMTNLTDSLGNVITNQLVEWINCDLYGEQSTGPSPRAFVAHNNAGGGMYVFGGRTGTLPTGSDTDSDWLDDDTEYELGGPAAGRDPRANALIAESVLLNTNATEKIPYAYKRLGGIPQWWPLSGFRTAIMDFESLDYELGLRIHAGILDLPIEGHAPGFSTVYETGYDAYVPEFTNLWWHRYGAGDPVDPRDDWELGEPHDTGLSSNTAPSVAHSGRWCYGTDLNGYYTDDSVMELYTPLFDLTVPASDSTATSPPNTNGFYLVFHEWLDLADASDMVRIEAVRPSTPADIVTRVSGVNPPRPVVTILPNRNNAYNTPGAWRRVVVPLEPVANETDLYFRFVLQSDESGHGGGWYIDDVAILQGGRISGLYTNLGTIYLFGTYGTNLLDSVSTGPGGDFGFDLVAAGIYRIVAGDGSAGTNVTIVGNNTWNVIVQDFEVDEIVLGIAISSPVLLTWNAVPGMAYEVQYTTPDTITSANPWTVLATVTATGDIAYYIDYESETVNARFYRVVLIGASP